MNKLTKYLTIIYSFVYLNNFLFAQQFSSKHFENVVLDVGKPGYWDAFGVYGHCILYKDNMYKMWYTGANGKAWTASIGYATSNDGIKWSKYSKNPILTGNSGAWDLPFTGLPSVIYHDGKYMMWYMGDNSRDQHFIGLATSPDGVNWESYYGNPIIKTGSSGQWDSKHVTGPSVLFKDNAFKMWYTNRGKIGYAISHNGINWSKHAGNPVFEDIYVEYPCVIWNGEKYVMFYGYSHSGRTEIGVAFSDDGISWKNHNDNPAIHQGKDWKSAYVNYPTVLYNNGIYKVWYAGMQSGTNKTKIGYSEIRLDSETVKINNSSG